MASNHPILLSYNAFEPVQGIEETNPIIFLHDVAVSKEYWGDIPQIVANATGRKAYTLDFRNHGDSEWSEVFDFHSNVGDLVYFMDTMEIRKAIIVGHGMGGTTAMKTTLRVPNRVEKMVSEDMAVRKVSPALQMPSLVYLNLAKQAERMIPPGSSMDEAKQFLIDYVYHKIPEKYKSLNNYQLNDPRLNLKRTTDDSYEFKCNLNLIQEILKDLNNEITSQEGCYEGPACFIHGKRSSFLVGQDEHQIKKYFPNVKMAGIEEAFHDVHDNFALEFTEALLTFIQGGWNKIKLKTTAV